MRGTANVSNLTPRDGVEPLDSIDEAEHARTDEIARIDAVGQAGTDTAGDELDQRRVVDDQAIAGHRIARLQPALPPVLDVVVAFSCSGMRFRVDGSKALLADVCVALRGGHIGVAKKILYHAKVRPTIEQVGGEAVSQGVGVGRALATTVEDPAHVARRQPNAPLVAEQRRARFRRRPRRRECEPGTQRIDGRSAERDPTLLAALAPHGDRAAGQIECIEVETAELADANTAAVQHLQHGIVAPSAPHGLDSAPIELGLVEQRRHLAVLEHSWEPGGPGGRPQRHRRIDLDIAREHEGTRSSDEVPQPCGRCCAWRTGAW